MLNRDEVELLIRIAREQHMDYGNDYESAYRHIDAVRGHKARIAALLKLESEWKLKNSEDKRNHAMEALKLLFVLNGNDYGGCKLGAHISCKDCPFNLGGPCALKSITGLGRLDKEPASYPRRSPRWLPESGPGQSPGRYQSGSSHRPGIQGRR